MAPEIPIERFEIYANGLDHPECLAFDDEGQLWAGGEAGQVYRITPEREVRTVADLGGFCAGVAWSPHGDLWVCNAATGILRVTSDGRWTVFAKDMICPNYGLFDARGNYWVTDSGNWKKRNGRLLRFSAEGARDVVLDGFGYTNGLALTADGRTLYMVESDTDRVFAVSPATGAAAVFAENVGRLPDGLALNGTGELFASCYASDDIYRIGPDGMAKLYAYDRWAILLSRPTNLTFRDGWLYVANLGRTTITRAKV